MATTVADSNARKSVVAGPLLSSAMPSGSRYTGSPILVTGRPASIAPWTTVIEVSHPSKSFRPDFQVSGQSVSVGSVVVLMPAGGGAGFPAGPKSRVPLSHWSYVVPSPEQTVFPTSPSIDVIPVSVRTVIWAGVK